MENVSCYYNIYILWSYDDEFLIYSVFHKFQNTLEWYW